MFNPFTSPIIKKDLKVISRSMKYSWGLFAYEAVLFLIFINCMMIFSVDSYTGRMTSNVDVYSGYVYFFPIIGVSQLGIIALIIPIITASSISGEKERKTMDVLLTTTITAPSIVMGKIGSAVVRVMIFIIASIPLIAMSFMVGGLSWITLFEYIVLAFLFACFAGSIGIFASSVCKKSITSIILSYVIYAVIYILPFAIWLGEFLLDVSRTDYYLAPVVLMVNPVFTFIVFFVERMTGENVLETLFGLDILSHQYIYMLISELIQIGMTACFISLASMRLRPGKK